MKGLVIERDEPIRNLILGCLRGAGLEVVGVGSAAESADAKADFLIVDESSCSPSEWASPSRDGAAPTFLLRTTAETSWPGWADLPFCNKPFSPPQFAMMVRLWLVDQGLLLPERRPRPAKAETLVLDLFSGSGLSMALAADAHAPGALVVGLDISRASVLRARENTRRLGYENLLWVVANANRLPFRDGVFDVVRGMENLNVLRNVEGVPEEVQRVSKTDGAC